MRMQGQGQVSFTEYSPQTSWTGYLDHSLVTDGNVLAYCRCSLINKHSELVNKQVFMKPVRDL